MNDNYSRVTSGKRQEALVLVVALLQAARNRKADRAKNKLTAVPRISCKNRIRTGFFLSPVTIYLSQMSLPYSKLFRFGFAAPARKGSSASRARIVFRGDKCTSSVSSLDTQLCSTDRDIRLTTVS